MRGRSPREGARGAGSRLLVVPAPGRWVAGEWEADFVMLPARPQSGHGGREAGLVLDYL